MLRGALEVAEFVPRRAADAASVDYPDEPDHIRSRLRLEPRTLTSCVAALASIALHALFVAPALWATGAPSRPTDQKSAGNTTLQWVVLDDSPAAAVPKPASLASPALVAISLSDILPTPESPASAPDASEDKNAQSDDRSSLGVMYGRYVGQIQARIERAWLRPRTAIGAPIFQCQAQIDQDRLGGVREVTLLQCNGDMRWRLSLVNAIEGASPLPAPPNPAVFARHVVLEFRAMAYSPGAQTGLYEPPDAPEKGAGPQEIARQSQSAFQALRRAAKTPDSRKVIRLRIEGSKVEVEPELQ